MSSLASVAELERHLGRTVDPVAGQQALDVASATIRTWCGWGISEEIDVTMTCDGTGTRVVGLPTLRLNAVAQVECAGQVLDPADFEWTRAGVLIHAAGWPRKARAVNATVSHGYEPVPGDVKGVCMSLAGQSIDNPGNVSVALVGTVSRTYDAELNEQQMFLLGPYQLPDA